MTRTVMRQRLHDTAVGVAAVVGLVAWLVVVPLLLWTWRHSPFPTALPSWHRLTTLIDGGYLDPDVIPNAVALVGWLAWAYVCRCIALDTRDRLRHRPGPARPRGVLHNTVTRWISAATLVA